MAQTITEKILAAHSGKKQRPSRESSLRLDWTFVWETISRLPSQSLNLKKSAWIMSLIARRIALVPDHSTPNKDIKSAELCRILRTFREETSDYELFRAGASGSGTHVAARPRSGDSRRLRHWRGFTYLHLRGSRCFLDRCRKHRSCSSHGAG